MEFYRFETARAVVSAKVMEDFYFEPIDQQEADAIERGAYVVFGIVVTVEVDGVKIGEESLWGNVYESPADFFNEHRDADPMKRNCSIFRAKNPNTNICHYFPSMVRAAVAEARDHLRSARPLYVRKAA